MSSRNMKRSRDMFLEFAISSRAVFEELPELERIRLAGISRSVSKAGNETLFFEGEPSRGVFILRSGGAKLFASGDVTGSGEQQFRQVGQGEVLGLSATIAEAEYEFSVRTDEPSTFAFIPREDFNDFLRSNSEACFRVVQLLGEQARAFGAGFAM